MKVLDFFSNVFNITKNHYTVAHEHIVKFNPSHEPTYFQAFRMTIYDLLFNKTIFIKEYKSHLVYEIVKVPTIGLRIANVIRVYVPKKYRGKGIASLMLDKIQEKTVISEKGKHGEVGRLFISRTNI